MAKPRVFVSSTYYDLKFLRSSMEVFINSLGFESVLSEKGDIPYSPFVSLDKSCYTEAQNCDIFVLIIGGRYGSPTSDDTNSEDSVENTYTSITKREFETANRKGIPCFILIESGVYFEYQTYKNNKNIEISYAHVDSKNVFRFIDEIISLKKNNPIFPFSGPQEIYSWLRDQWSGIFRDLLSNQMENASLTDLQNEISSLRTITDSLKNYLESIIIKTKEGSQIIENENSKIEKEKRMNKLKSNALVAFLIPKTENKSINEALNIISQIKTEKDFIGFLIKFGFSKKEKETDSHLKELIIDDINQCKILMGEELPEFK
ncbi:DUF4062 domain-containing protein [Acetobacter persici]|uniref:DUF4062 domain-containing protein n=1 Tax=Acetobacter persici TaxID=1076596 RepID=UPI0036D9B356